MHQSTPLQGLRSSQLVSSVTGWVLQAAAPVPSDRHTPVEQGSTSAGTSSGVRVQGTSKVGLSTQVPVALHAGALQRLSASARQAWPTRKSLRRAQVPSVQTPTAHSLNSAHTVPFLAASAVVATHCPVRLHAWLRQAASPVTARGSHARWSVTPWKLVQTPLSQAPAWQGLAGLTQAVPSSCVGRAPTHSPAWQVELVVQGLWSSQEAPSTSTTTTPRPGSQA